MDDAVADSAQAMVPETILDEAEHVGEQMIAVRIRCFPPFLEQVLAHGALHDEPRLRLVLVEQALAEQGGLGRRDLEQAEFDARRSRVETSTVFDMAAVSRLPAPACCRRRCSARPIPGFPACPRRIRAHSANARSACRGIAASPAPLWSRAPARARSPRSRGDSGRAR